MICTVVEKISSIHVDIQYGTDFSQSEISRKLTREIDLKILFLTSEKE